MSEVNPVRKWREDGIMRDPRQEEIDALREETAKVRLDRESAWVAMAQSRGEAASLRADLERVTRERDEWHKKWEESK